MKTSFENWLAGKIARTMLLIKATTFKKLTEEPYKWACGMLMRIYNDNRMMLGNYKHRMRIAQGFINLIEKRKIEFSYLIGTVTSGIAPAATVAQLMNKKLLINHKGDYFVYSEKLCDELILEKIRKQNSQPNLVISTSPFVIPHGVQYANELKIGFAYTREAKDHGKKQPVEGIIKPRMKFIFIHEKDSPEEEIGNLIKKMENDFNITCVKTLEMTSGFEKITSIDELKNHVAIVIEDLFSTGASSAIGVYLAREAGMICNYCFSIFTYGFDFLAKQFSGENFIGDKNIKLSTPCEIDSLLSFSALMEQVEKLKFYKPDVIKEMWEENEKFDERYKNYLELKDEA